MTQLTDQPVAPLAYAPPVRRESKVWAGFAIAFLGLVLLFFAGCFFIGILIHLQPNMGFGGATPVVWSKADYLFHAILYLLGFAFLAAGALLVVQGARGLLRILMDATS